MNLRKINKTDYSFLLSLDKKIYPTKNPINNKNLNQWYKKNPEFGMIFEEKKITKGMVIIIPLNEQAWKNLTSGKLAESDLSKNEIFNSKKDNKIGIHIYHIEKMSNNLKHLHKKMLLNLEKILKKIEKQKNKKIKIIGFSGLCVTKKGINLFEKKLNCKEKKFKSKEHILEKKEKLVIIETKSKKDLKKYTTKGYSYKNRCKLLITTPKMKSPVWEYLN